MNKYYRIVTKNGTKGAWTNIDGGYDIMYHTRAPWPFYRDYNKHYNNYLLKYHCWFTEKWYYKHALKIIKELQTEDVYIAILTTNSEPAFYDGMQAMFKYRGSEKLDKIEIITLKLQVPKLKNKVDFYYIFN